MPRQRVPRAVSEQTRERILTVAEQLFSESGYDAVSLRKIGTEADVPFALVTYHFRTKLGLYQTVFSRRIAEFQVHRRALLEQVVIEEDIYQVFLSIAAAFVGPRLRLRRMAKGAQCSQLLAREIFDPNEAGRGVIAEYLDPLARLMLELLHKVAPEASHADVARAYQFATGVLGVNHVGGERLKRISGLSEKALNAGNPTDQLVRFMAAGLLSALYPQLMEDKLSPAGPRDSTPRPTSGEAVAPARTRARKLSA